MPKEPMTEGRIAEIRGREKAATQGPWGQMMVWDGGVDYGTWVNDVLAKNGVTICSFTPLKNNEANADFVAHAREDIPALLDEVERLRKRQAWLIKHVVQIGGFICPMPENYECEHHVGVLCCFDSLEKRERCWEMAFNQGMEQKED